jgi:hypothetical protein
MVKDLLAEALRILRASVVSRRAALRSTAPPWAARVRDAGHGAEGLIPYLAADLRAVPRRTPSLGLAAAAAVGVLIALLWLGAERGFQPGAITPAALSVKLAYALAVGGLSLWAAARLSCPEGGETRHLVWIAGPVVVMAAIALPLWLGAAPGCRMGLLMGQTVLACPVWIVGAALPSLAGLLKVTRGQAPTRPVLTGALLGVTAGAAGAIAYAVFCRETSLVFIAVWYGLGMALAGGVGAVLGAWLLRW